jgi:hypothetical protein
MRPSVPSAAQAIPNAHKPGLNIPMGGEWYYTQSAAMVAYRKHQEKVVAKTSSPGILIAWDKKPTKGQANHGSKYYGFYSSSRSFFESFTEMDAQNRWGYELIPEGLPSRFYLDVEWVGEEDHNHLKIKWILREFTQYINQKLKVVPQFYVACATRGQVDGEFFCEIFT